MSKAIYICNRHKPMIAADEKRLAGICHKLAPDNLTRPARTVVSISGRIAYGIIACQPSVKITGHSILLGCLFSGEDRWAEPGTDFPDGSYALFRNNETYFEAVSDAAASRTVWYYIDDERFIAATSQRAIIAYLGDFLFDERVIPWMLSTGSLGPDLSWDRRIRRLAPDASVLLDKQKWTLSLTRNPIVFSVKERTRADHAQRLREAIATTMESVKKLDFADWILPLSGGYDSRAILCFLRGGGSATVPVRSITWGLKQNDREAGNDARIAREVAGALGVPHAYYHTDIADAAVEEVLDRFLQCGEGRIDHLSGYMDGLEIWRRLLENERVHGIIRGDEGFGWTPVSSEATVKHSIGCALCSDFANLRDVIAIYRLASQEYPEELSRNKTETIAQWRDRLYHGFRLPTVLAALSDIKLSYVEQINPLLSKSILSCVRELPDGLRTDKSLFREIVDSMSPPVPYAKRSANAVPSDLLRQREVAALLKAKLASDTAGKVFPGEFLHCVRCGIAEENTGNSTGFHARRRVAGLRAFVPRRMKNWWKDHFAKIRVDGNILAFRVYIVIRMHELLSHRPADIQQESG